MSSMPVTFVHRVVTIHVLVILLTACGHEPVRRLSDNGKSSVQSQPGSHSHRRSPAEQAVIVAVRQIGVPYRYGGSTAAGFDCSGLVQFPYASVGKSIPRTAADQWRQLSPVSGDDPIRPRR